MDMHNQIRILIQRYPTLTPLEDNLCAAVDKFIQAYEGGHKALFCGNGGSAADADHIVGELMKGFCKRRPIPKELSDKLSEVSPELADKLTGSLQMPMRAINLTQHSALTTAFANDADPDLCFAQQALGFTDPGDVFVGITTSGNAKNVLAAAVVAKAKGAFIIAMTGENGGKLAQVADILLSVPGREAYQIQELHLPAYHAICLAVEERFFPV